MIKQTGSKASVEGVQCSLVSAFLCQTGKCPRKCARKCFLKQPNKEANSVESVRASLNWSAAESTNWAWVMDWSALLEMPCLQCFKQLLYKGFNFHAVAARQWNFATLSPYAQNNPVIVAKFECQRDTQILIWVGGGNSRNYWILGKVWHNRKKYIFFKARENNRLLPLHRHK